jgi:glycosyltransferase involved in cell wall biosynthesis
LTANAQMTATTIPKPQVLIGMGSYWPGAGANGPIKSLVNLMAALQEDFDLKVVARDRPFGATMPPAGIQTWVWHEGPDGFPVLYVPAPETGVSAMRHVLATTPHDLLYLNGFFDREFTLSSLVARRLQSRAARKPVIVAPRGEFAPGAIGYKSGRKRIYLGAARATGLLSGAAYHATTRTEADEIAAAVRSAAFIGLATNIADPLPTWRPRHPKRAGRCRLIFSGRIVPIKNLDVALDVLSRVTVPVDFDICGDIEDQAYWATCRKHIERLPSHIKVDVHGRLTQAALQAKLANADALFLPTGGENFGHAIVEAMQAGLPVIISDRTPWLELEQRGVGWSLPLGNPLPFARAIETIAGMDQHRWDVMSQCARDYAEGAVAREPAIAAHRAMFQAALQDPAQ